MERLLSQKEVAQLIGQSVRNLERLRIDGGGPVYIKLGGRCVRYRETDVEAWIASRVRASTSDPGRTADAR